MQRILSIIFAILLIVAIGCSQGPPRPAGFPVIIPCRIIVLQDGVPLAGADVVLVPVNPTGTVWAVGGQTNDSGVAVMRTHGEHVGAPIDHFNVVVTKFEREVLRPEGETTGPMGGMYIPEIANLYDLVDPVFGSASTTTLQIEVARGTPEHTVDVGAAVRILRRQPG